MTATLLDVDGAELATATATRHSEGLPRPYWPLGFDIAEPGIDSVRVDTGSGPAELAFSVSDPASVVLPKPGDAMVPLDTPTTVDARGVDPICTRRPFCPLHDLTLTEALGRAAPVAFLVATPAFCQTAACGPVVDVLTAQRDAHPDIAMVHPEAYTDTSIETTRGDGRIPPAVRASALPGWLGRRHPHAPRFHLRRRRARPRPARPDVTPVAPIVTPSSHPNGALLRHMGMDDVRSGDVIELGDGDDAATALVLLVSDDGAKLIVDRCDGNCPEVVERAELGEFRVFRPELVAA